MNYKKSLNNLVKIKCSRYTEVDEIIINEATKLGLPLIGGTALEILASAYNIPGVRKRSDNDIDVIAYDLDTLNSFIKKSKEILKQHNLTAEDVKIDAYLTDKNIVKNFSFKVDGVLLMKPEWLLHSKLVRGTDKDIKWLLKIPQMTDDDINYALDTLGVTTEEFELLTSLL